MNLAEARRRLSIFGLEVKRSRFTRRGPRFVLASKRWLSNLTGNIRSTHVVEEIPSATIPENKNDNGDLGDERLHSACRSIFFMAGRPRIPKHWWNPFASTTELGKSHHSCTPLHRSCVGSTLRPSLKHRSKTCAVENIKTACSPSSLANVIYNPSFPPRSILLCSRGLRPGGVLHCQSLC